jgi:hypothetical protein
VIAMNPRFRLLVRAALILAVAWVLALAGFSWARASKPTAEKLAAYLRSTELAGLSGEARGRALGRLADLLNALPPEERRKARVQGLWGPWVREMTDEERVTFIEATAPMGFQQMLSAFELMPPDRRQHTIDEALKRLREVRQSMETAGEDGMEGAEGAGPGGEEALFVLSDEMRQRVATLGLKTYYSQSTARTKAEMAPLLEELQQLMESGRFLRGPMRRPRE